MRPTLATALLIALATPAAAKVPLPDEAFINAQLRAAQVGDILRKTCPDAGARMFVVWRKLNALKSYAAEQGYSEAEVEAFVEDRAEKRRLKAEAEAYLAQAGAVPGDPESYCRIARDEVARGTLTGQLIWVD